MSEENDNQPVDPEAKDTLLSLAQLEAESGGVPQSPEGKVVFSVRDAGDLKKAEDAARIVFGSIPDVFVGSSHSTKTIQVTGPQSLLDGVMAEVYKGRGG